MRLAETGDPILVELQDRQAAWERNPALAMKYIERHEPGYAPVPSEPFAIEVVYGPTVGQEGDPA